MLCHAKDKTSTLEKSGVYQLSCDDCPVIYIGETGRQIGQRVREHMNRNGTSTFSKHLASRGYNFSLDSDIKILHQLGKFHKLTLMEAYEIRKAQNNNIHLTNEQLEISYKPIYEYLM